MSKRQDLTVGFNRSEDRQELLEILHDNGIKFSPSEDRSRNFDRVFPLSIYPSIGIVGDNDFYFTPNEGDYKYPADCDIIFEKFGITTKEQKDKNMNICVGFKTEEQREAFIRHVYNNGYKWCTNLSLEAVLTNGQAEFTFEKYPYLRFCIEGGFVFEDVYGGSTSLYRYPEDIETINKELGIKPTIDLRSVTITTVKRGDSVIRGKDWAYGNQDGGIGNIGTITDPEGHENIEGEIYCRVEWQNGHSNVYRVGPNFFDLYYAIGKSEHPLTPDKCFKSEEEATIASLKARMSKFQ